MVTITKSLMIMSKLLSTNVVVSILVSVYRHKQRVDCITVHYSITTTSYS